MHAPCGAADVGVYLLRGETVYSNNSLIFIEETTKLQCITDRMPCCATPPNRVGQWQFPNQTNVGISGTTTSFYRDRGDDGTVNLNRDDDGIIITGLFCCMVPDADDIINQTLCISIGKLMAQGSYCSFTIIIITFSCCQSHR